MKRLTKRNSIGNVMVPFGDDNEILDVYTRLAELEDKLESGLLVELPCLREKKTIFYKGDSIRQKELNYMNKYGTICSVVFSEDEFEEAEAMLKELRGKK